MHKTVRGQINFNYQSRFIRGTVYRTPTGAHHSGRAIGLLGSGGVLSPPDRAHELVECAFEAGHRQLPTLVEQMLARIPEPMLAFLGMEIFEERRANALAT
jgi:hypothetical protein